MLQRLMLAFVCALVCLPARAQDGGTVFRQAWSLVRDQFYDAALHGVDWRAVLDELEPRALAAETDDELSAVINEALDRLGASHMRHMHRGQAAYYELLDIFNPDGHRAFGGERVTYVGLGISTATIDARVFIADVFETGPAHRAGLRAGDELVSIDGEAVGYAPALSTAEGEQVRVVVRREGPDAEPVGVLVSPDRINPRELYTRAMREGAAVHEVDGQRVAHVRVRSYAHPDYHDVVMELATGEFAGADALVLDIRGGWGGASPEYMSLVNPFVPRLESRRRGSEDWGEWRAAWHKPLVLLIDGGSRSGKELLAHAYKRHGAARLVGERTAGAVLAGSPRPLADGSLLYVAVADVRVGGVRLEGVGVEPDVRVGRELPYSAGRDVQLKRALEEVAAMAASQGG